MWLASLKLFDVTISDLSNNKSYPTFFVSTIHTCNISLVSLRTLHSLNFLCTKNIFFVLQKVVAQFLHVNKKFFLINFFQKFFITYFSEMANIQCIFPPGGKYLLYFSPTANISYFKLFEIKLILQKMFCITFHIVYVLVTLANVTYRVIRLRYMMFANITHSLLWFQTCSMVR